MMAALEEADDPRVATGDVEAPKAILGAGDLLDDFVVAAARAEPSEACAAEPGAGEGLLGSAATERPADGAAAAAAAADVEAWDIGLDTGSDVSGALPLGCGLTMRCPLQAAIDPAYRIKVMLRFNALSHSVLPFASVCVPCHATHA
jgi:hypothetical protein